MLTLADLLEPFQACLHIRGRIPRMVLSPPAANVHEYGFVQRRQDASQKLPFFIEQLDGFMSLRQKAGLFRGQYDVGHG